MCNATKQIVNEHFSFKLHSKLYQQRRNVIMKLKKPNNIVLFDITYTYVML